MAKNELKKVTTKAGTAVYPHLRSTEKFDGEDTGKYVCAIQLNEADTQELVSIIENEWEMAKKSPALDGKAFGRNTNPTLGIHEDKNGNITFKAKTNAVIKTKAGEVFEKDVPVFDRYGKLYDKDIELGHGSTIKMCMLLRPFYASSRVYGVQLLLKAVQVLDYVAPSSGVCTADECGFDIEEAPTNVDDSPFTVADEDF